MIFSSVGSAHALPIVQTNPATNVTETSAVLNGVITPNTQTYTSSWRFWYNPASSPGSATDCPTKTSPIDNTLPPGSPPTPVYCTVNGLQPSTTYNFLLEGAWLGLSGAPAAGVTLSFTTSPPPSPPSLSISPTSGPPGTVVKVSGSGYNGSVTYSLCLSSSSSSISCVPGTGGSFMAVSWEGPLSVPSGTAPGSYFVIVYGGSPAAIAVSTPFTVTTGPSPPICSTWRAQMVASTSQPVYSVGDEIIVSWSPHPSIPGELTLTGPSGTYNFSLDQGAMSQGILDSGKAEQGDVGFWTATLTVFGQGGCPSNYLPAQVGFQVESAPTTSTAVTTTTTVVSTTMSGLPFDYSVTVSPSTQSVELGGSTSYVVSVLLVAGSPVPVSLTVMGCPGDVRSSFTTQSAIPPYTSILNLDLTTSTANPGAYTLTVEATAAGGNVKSATATLTIQQKSTQTTVTETTTSGSSLANVIQQNSLIIITALLVIAVLVLGVVATRSRGRRGAAAPPQAGAAPVFCGKCGTENPASNEFCTNCGEELKHTHHR